MPLCTALGLGEHAIGGVEVNGPAAVRNGVAVKSLFDDVLLLKNIWSY